MASGRNELLSKNEGIWDLSLFVWLYIWLLFHWFHAISNADQDPVHHNIPKQCRKCFNLRAKNGHTVW